MKKIMFNDKYGLTQAVLDGRKTQTRRIIEIDEEELTLFQTIYYNQAFDFLEGRDLIEAYFNNYPKKIPYKKGEIVAIAQKYEDVLHIPAGMRKGAGWSNKMFVKAELMPHQIRITNVRIERLQDISYDDCLAEGIIKKWHAPACRNYFYLPNVEVKSTKDVFDSPSEAYAALIDKVGKKGVWESNPYVFVYDFELIK